MGHLSPPRCSKLHCLRVFYKVPCDVLGGASYPCWERWVRIASTQSTPSTVLLMELTKHIPSSSQASPIPASNPSRLAGPCGSGYPQLGNPGAIPLPGSQGDTPTHTRKFEDELNLHLAVGVCYSWLLGASRLVCAPQGPAPHKGGGRDTVPSSLHAPRNPR